MNQIAPTQAAGAVSDALDAAPQDGTPEALQPVGVRRKERVGEGRLDHTAADALAAVQNYHHARATTGALG